jgi:hypothetical protein
LPPRHCPYCQQSFQPSRSHPNQRICSRPKCQRRRHIDYRRQKLASDSAYAEKCRESARQWRKQHSAYWEHYRQSHPESVVRNREQQQGRDRKRHLTNLANNTLASELKRCPGTVWLVGAGLHDLANNTLAPAQLWILEALPRRLPVAPPLANNTALAS